MPYAVGPYSSTGPGVKMRTALPTCSIAPQCIVLCAGAQSFFVPGHNRTLRRCAIGHCARAHRSFCLYALFVVLDGNRSGFQSALFIAPGLIIRCTGLQSLRCRAIVALTCHRCAGAKSLHWCTIVTQAPPNCYPACIIAPATMHTGITFELPLLVVRAELKVEGIYVKQSCSLYFLFSLF